MLLWMALTAWAGSASTSLTHGSLGVEALGGVSNLPGAAGQLRAVGAVGHRGERLHWTVGGSTTWFAGLTARPLDFHLVDASVFRTEPTGVGGGLLLRAGAAQGWADGVAGLGARIRLGRVRVQGRVGPALRATIADSAGGVGATIQAVMQPTPKLRVEHRAELRSWWDLAASPLTVDASLAARFFPHPDLELVGQVAGAWYAKPPSDQGRLGFTDATLRAGRGSVGVNWWLGRSVGLILEGTAEGVETGAVRAANFRVLLGVNLRWGRARERPAVEAAAGPTFRYVDANATLVQVAGSFSEWSPLELDRDGSEWTLELDLKPGTYEYLYLVDGQPVTPPDADITRDDGFGGRNGVLVVSE